MRKKVCFHDMKRILWHSICPSGEALHVSYASASEGGSWRLHGHDFFEVFWVDSGVGWHLLGEEGHSVPLRPGQLVFIRERDVHGFEAAASAEPFALINLAFPSTAWEHLVQRYALDDHVFFNGCGAEPPVAELGGEVAQFVSAQFRDLIHQPRGAMERDGFLLTLARLTAGPGRDAGEGAAPAWLRRALHRAASDLTVLRGGVEALSRVAGYSEGHLSRTMRATMGRTPSDWMAARRLVRAERLLESSGLSVSDVAAEAGYENLSHFHRCFKKAHGLTPLSYRKARARRAF